MTPTREQVIQWAREGCGVSITAGSVLVSFGDMQRFADLAFAAGAKSEREACAKECDKPNEYGFHRTCYEVQEAIRARRK